MSRALSLAGFQVTIIGRFWVIAEASSTGDLFALDAALIRGITLGQSGTEWAFNPERVSVGQHWC